MDMTEKTVHRNYVYRGKILSRCAATTLCAPTAAPANGKSWNIRAARAYCTRKTERLLFVRQYRYAYGEVVTGNPRGETQSRGRTPPRRRPGSWREEAGRKSGGAAAALYDVSHAGVHRRKHLHIPRGRRQADRGASRRRGVCVGGVDPRGKGAGNAGNGRD